MALSISRHKGILNKTFEYPCFLWTFEYRRKGRVNKAIKEIALIEDASDAFGFFCNNYLKCLFVNFLSTFSFISMLVYS